MRTLSATLTAAQKAASRTPYIVLQAHNKIGGVERFSFSRLYTGGEAEASHGAAIANDGSLIRARVSGGTIWTQRVTAPDPLSTYSSWTDSGTAVTKPIVVTKWSTEVSIFYVKEATAEVRRMVSFDNGATWSDELIKALGAPPLLATGRIAAAHSPLGNTVVFYIRGDNNAVWWTYWNGAAWTAWASQSVGSTWVMTEIATCARSDEDQWPLSVAGTTSASDRNLQLACFQFSSQLISDAENITVAPSASLYTPTKPFLLEIDGTVHIYFLHSFTGVTAVDRMYHCWLVPGSGWNDTPVTEPEPFNHTCTQGLAPALATSYVWLCKPAGVWRSARTVTSADLSANVLRIKSEEDGDGGSALFELRNDDGRYASPGSGSLAALTVGAELRLGLGCYSAAGGNEYSWANYYNIDEIIHTSAGGKATLILKASLPRRRLELWSARYAMRWNPGGAANKTIIMIFRQLFARAGIELNALTFSAIADTYCPDFTVYPGQHGGSATGILQKMVPDVLRSNLNKFDQVNPQAADSSVYTYGTDHAILEGQYATIAPPVTRVRAEGRNAGAPVLEDSFDWSGAALVGDRLSYVFDLNIDSAADATNRGTAILRDAAILGTEGTITVPANVGQQLFDVVSITDSRAGLSAAKRRIVRLRLEYDARKSVYAHTLGLGAT